MLALPTLLLVGLAAASPLTERTDTTLKATARPRYFGAALAAAHLANTSDPLFARIAAAEFSGVTPENEMKWETVEPQPGQFNFTPGDAIADFATTHGMKLRGHTLVWHSQLAPWVANLTGNALSAAMTRHINSVMGHFKGKTYAWDVVNEAFNDDGTFRVSPWYTQLGSGYIEQAFRLARAVKGDNSKLYINDYNVEGINAKSDALYAVVKDLKKKGLIDGVGLQAHLIVGQLPTDIEANIQRFAKLGVDVAITELDIRGPTPLNSTQIAQHARDFASVTRACVAVSRCVGITTWGITDAYSWIPGVFAGEGYGLLWDENYVKKLAYYATLKAL